MIKGKIKVRWLVNLLLSAFFVFAVLLATERIFMSNTVWYEYVKKSWPLIFCFPMGIVGSKNKTLKYILLFFSVIGVCFFISLCLLPWDAAYDVLFMAVLLFMSAFIYFMGTKHIESFPSKLTIATVIIYLAELLLLEPTDAGALLPLNFCAIASFVIGLLNFNSLSLLNGVHNAKGGSSMPIPVGIRGKNILLLAGFFVMSLLVGNLLPIGAWIVYLLSIVAKGIWGFLMFVGSLNGKRVSGPEPTPEGTGRPDIIMVDVPENPYAHVFIVVFLSIVIIIFFIIIFFMLKNSGVELKNLLKALKKSLNVGQVDTAYEENIEKIFSLKDLLKKRRRDFGDFFQKLFSKPVRFDDLPDNRAKVRFTYKNLQKKIGIDKSGTALTPIEVGRTLDSEKLERLTEDYSWARYNDIEPVEDNAVHNAREALSDIHKIKEKRKNGNV